MDNIPKSGFDDLNNFIGSFPDLDLKLAYGKIKVSSNIFEVNDHVFKDNQSIDQASIDLIVNGITSCEEIIRVNNIKEDASL